MTKEKDLFKVFGKFQSTDAINEAARGLVAEGDVDNLKILAKENGLDEEMAEYMVAGEIDFLCDNLTAAMGRINVELEAYEDSTYKGLALEIYETMKGYLGREKIVVTVNDACYSAKVNVTNEELACAIMKSNLTLHKVTSDIVALVRSKQSKGGWVPSVTLCALVMDMYLRGDKA